MVAGHDMSPVHERIDRSCDLLRSVHRRRVIYALRENGPSTADELADAVASGVSDGRRRVLTALVHTHLPKLAEADVIEYDGRDDVVSLSDGVERLEPFLSVAAREENDWEQPSSVESRATNTVSTGCE